MARGQGPGARGQGRSRPWPALSPIAAYQRLVRWAFQRLYRELAGSYDLVAWLVSAGRWRGWVLAALPELRGRVLELGCGPGHLQAALAARPGPPAIGIDSSAQMLARAARRAPRLARADARAIPFAAGSFDTVCATFPAEYILDPATHAEIRRVLAPAGRLVVVDGGQLRGGWYGRLVGLVYRVVWAGRPAPLPQRQARLGGLSLQVRQVAVGASTVLVMIGAPADAADA